MKKLAAVAGAAVLGLSAQASYGFSTTATIQFEFGGNSASAGVSRAAAPYSDKGDIGWTSNGNPPNDNQISTVAASTFFTTLGGFNSVSYYNPDFASTAGCAPGAGIVPALSAVDTYGAPTEVGKAFDGSVTARKYGCRWNIVTNSFGSAGTFSGSPITDVGPNVGKASGTLTVTDTTLTGTLTILSTTDEPSGGSLNSIGTGTNGYNYRTADGSPFGNAWYGITTSGTLTVDLTGTFTDGTSAGAWSINGGSVKFTQAGFLCQQGGLSTPANILCTASTAGGGYQTDGGALSWGFDSDGSGANTTLTAIPVKDAGGAAVISNVSGVLANLSVSASGAITTSQGEFRRALGSAGGGCGDHIRFDGTKIACGTLTAGKLAITGQVVPAPAAVWLLGSGVGLLVARRKLMKKA